jgi:PAS domain S-box-containing protein
MSSEPIRVLHVDDDPQFGSLVADFLVRESERMELVSETSASGGIDLLRAQNETFDCIVSDYDMPNTDGIELLEIIREKHPNLPFILFTAKGDETVASDAFAADATDYMQKKIGSEQYEVLANRVQNAVDQYRMQQRFWNALSWYQRLVEQNLAGVFITKDGEFIYVNQQLANILETSQSELIGTSPLTLASGPGDEAAIEKLLDANHEGESFQVEFTAQRRDGVDIPVEVHGGSITHEGEPGRIGLLWDCSDVE